MPLVCEVVDGPPVRILAVCHPERAVKAHGLCGRCYDARREADPAVRARRKELRRRGKTSRARHYRHEFGLTLGDVKSLILSQAGACVICGTNIVGTYANGQLLFVVDHCHSTGKIRNVLCTNCNLGLGSFRDNPSALVAAATYLQNWADRESPYGTAKRRRFDNKPYGRAL